MLSTLTRRRVCRATQAPYQTNLLIAGWDADTGPSLYYLDYMACLHKMSTASHGYGARPRTATMPRVSSRALDPPAGGSFVLSLMDKAWRPGMSVEEALALADAAIAEVRCRLVVAPPNYVIKIVDKDGARVLAERVSAEVVNSS